MSAPTPDTREMLAAERDVLAETERIRGNLRPEGAANGEIPDLVGRILRVDNPDKPHPRSRLALCAAYLIVEIERLDRAHERPAGFERDPEDAILRVKAVRDAFTPRCGLKEALDACRDSRWDIDAAVATLRTLATGGRS